LFAHCKSAAHFHSVRVQVPARRSRPGNLPFEKAATGLIQDYGRLRVQAILTAIPNDPRTTDSDALVAAKAADPEEQRHE